MWDDGPVNLINFSLFLGTSPGSLPPVLGHYICAHSRTVPTNGLKPSNPGVSMISDPAIAMI